MVIVNAMEDSETAIMPSEELLTAMGKFNEELGKAGVMLSGEGLQPSSKGARVRFAGDNRTVIDGPFAETKELVAGFWRRDDARTLRARRQHPRQGRRSKGRLFESQQSNIFNHRGHRVHRENSKDGNVCKSGSVLSVSSVVNC